MNSNKKSSDPQNGGCLRFKNTEHRVRAKPHDALKANENKRRGGDDMLDQSPQTKVDSALRKLEETLASGNVDAAVNLFQKDCFWRDLVTFTWNLRTLEGHDQVRDMLKRQLAVIKPNHFRQNESEPASEGDGITQGWFDFETDVARGYGHIRLKNGLIWTLLTTMTELKGHEEPQDAKRPMGAEHGSDRNRKT
jgi:putative flavoprotein involved in K+ transport